MDHIWEALTIKVMKCKQNFLKIIQEALKQPFQHVNFFKLFLGEHALDPLEPFSFRNQLQISSFSSAL